MQNHEIVLNEDLTSPSLCNSAADFLLSNILPAK